MTVNYTTNLALGQPVTGTESGTWGDDVNNAVTSYLDIAIAGGLAITVTTADVTLTLTQGTSSATNIGSTTAQYAILNISGAMTAARNLILPSSSRQYVINNNTTGGFALTVKGSATSGVTMVNGEKSHVFWNGSDYAKLSNAPGGAGSFTNITGSANAIISVTDNTNAALRITQLGTGNALLVEDSTNPDSTPFVINAAGNVGINTTAPAAKLNVAGTTIISNVDVLNATYDSVSFSVTAEETQPASLSFSADGSKMFVMGFSGDDVNEYVLSTPWVVSSATYSTVFSVAAQDATPHGLFFRADGLKMYVVGQTSDTVFQYALTSPWSVATASYESLSFSVAAQDDTPSGVFFKPNGLSMYVVGNTNDSVYQYTLSTAWNVSTATYLQAFSVAGQEGNAQDVSFTGDGTRMSVLGSTGDDVNVYNLTTPWDISTASSVGAVSVAAQEITPLALYIKPDGTKMYVVGSTNDTVFQYTVPSVEIQLTGTTSINGSATVAQDLTVNGDFNTSGSITSAVGFDSASTFGFKNRFINGQMQVAQRGTTGTSGAAVPTTAPTYPSIDRWYAYATGATVTVAQVAGSGANKNNLQVSGAASVTAVGVGQRIEQLNCYDLAGSTCTLSVNISNSLLTTVTWTASYATSADTWSAKTTIATGTFTVTSTLKNYNAQISVPAAATTGIEILFTVGAQTSGTWVIGNAQLEKSSIATTFDYRPYGTELALCQRYYYRTTVATSTTFGVGLANTTVAAYGFCPYPVTMRISPTSLEQSGVIADYRVRVAGLTIAASAVPTFLTANPAIATVQFTVASGLTAGQALLLESNAATFLGWSAEL